MTKVLSNFVFSNKVSLKYDLLIEESAVNTSKERMAKTFNEFLFNVVPNLGINTYNVNEVPHLKWIPLHQLSKSTDIVWILRPFKKSYEEA